MYLNAQKFFLRLFQKEKGKNSKLINIGYSLIRIQTRETSTSVALMSKKLFIKRSQKLETCDVDNYVDSLNSQAEISGFFSRLFIDFKGFWFKLKQPIQDDFGIEIAD